MFGDSRSDHWQTESYIKDLNIYIITLITTKTSLISWFGNSTVQYLSVYIPVAGLSTHLDLY